MPDLIGNRWLDNAVIGAIIEELQLQTERARPLRFLDRVDTVDAVDDEIFGRWNANRFAADIIADDQKAVVVATGRIETVATTIPNIKLGSHISQSMFNRMDALSKRGGSRAEMDAMGEFWNNLIEYMLLAVRERQNALVCGMMLDSIIYDRWGIKISTSYGAPSDLKVTPSTPWTSTSATPITDVGTAKNNAQQTYGKVYNRMTLPYADFSNLIATTEFKNLSTALYGQFAATTAMVNVQDRETMKSFVGRLLNLDVEIEDATYQEQQAPGTAVTRRVLPLGKVILSAKEDDKDGRVMDLANAVVTESMVAQLAGPAFEGLGGEKYGPVGYWTLSSPDLDPPGAVAWAVARCFPRRKQKEATAVLTVQ